MPEFDRDLYKAEIDDLTNYIAMIVTGFKDSELTEYAVMALLTTIFTIVESE